MFWSAADVMDSNMPQYLCCADLVYFLKGSGISSGKVLERESWPLQEETRHSTIWAKTEL